MTVSDATIREGVQAAFDADHADCDRDCTINEADREHYESIVRAAYKVFARHHAIDELVRMDFGNQSEAVERIIGKVQLPRPRPANYIEQETE